MPAAPRRDIRLLETASRALLLARRHGVGRPHVPRSRIIGKSLQAIAIRVYYAVMAEPPPNRLTFTCNTPYEA
jgi:hypothetical protein